MSMDIDQSSFTEEEQAFIEDIRPKLAELETLRKAKEKVYVFRKKMALMTAPIWFSSLVALDGLLLWVQRGNEDGGAGLSFIVSGLVWRWVTKPKRDYKHSYKKDILPKIVDQLGDLKYMFKPPEATFYADKYLKSKILPRYDRVKIEDFFYGEYKGTKIELFEPRLQQRRRSKNRTYYVDVFEGLMIGFEMPKKTFGHTIVVKDVGSIRRMVSDKKSGLSHANLVDPEFEKQYDAFTSDQVEARYIIDPVMIEKFAKLQEQYMTNKIQAAFYDNKVLLMLESKHNYFEPPKITIPATSEMDLIMLKREIRTIFGILDHLDLVKEQLEENSNSKIAASH